jgi:hypothetical protein
MKKILLSAGICVISFLGVQAQETGAKSAPTLEQKVDKMMKALTASCNLTPDQITKAKPIVEEAVKTKMANKQQYASDKTKLKAANQSALTTMNTKMNAMLNTDQQAKLAAFEKEKAASAQKKKAATTTDHQ